MHNWGATNVDWKGLNDAAYFLGEFMRKWGRMGVHTKEKYGTVRASCMFGWHSIHDLTHPGYAYIQYKRNGILWKLAYSRRVMPLIFQVLNLVVRPYHVWLYRRAYRLAISKWPLLREEILLGADWSEYLEEFGLHRIRTADRCYTVQLEWHPDNFSARYPEKETDVDEVEK